MNQREQIEHQKAGRRVGRAWQAKRTSLAIHALVSQWQRLGLLQDASHQRMVADLHDLERALRTDVYDESATYPGEPSKLPERA